MATSVTEIVEKITEYIQIRTELIKLKVISAVSRLLANVLAVITIMVILFFLVFFLSFGVGFYLNEALESNYLGHLIVAGFYLLLILIIFILAKSGKIQGWFETLILKIADQEDEPED